MRAWIISDLHYSHMDALGGAPFRIPDADICVCAGDISNHISTSIAYLLRDIEPHMPVILVLGNHDYYDSSIDFALERGKRDFPRTLTPVISTVRLGVGNGIWSGGCSLCEVEG